ncbi:MAG: hypothetical protein HYX34_15865 [Actinobacteria bacterium]|nr:hypothetical protein [Actinomycetota bacterium]
MVHPARRRRLAAAVAAAALVVVVGAAAGVVAQRGRRNGAADGQGTPGRPAVATPPALGPATDICAWLGTRAVARAVGRRVRTTARSDDGQGAPRCTYLLEPDGVSSVDVLVYPSGGRAVFNAGRSVRASVPVRGIGDEAYWRPEFGDLTVRAGDRAATVQLELFPPARDGPRVAATLAAPLVERLRRDR